VTEDDHQEKIFDWANSNLDKYPELELLYANMNGVRRSKRYTAKLKRRGMKSGIPDMFLPVSRHDYNGLYIELKRPKTKEHNKGYTSSAQRKWMSNLKKQGYAAIVCYGSEESIEILKHYLEC